MDLITQKNKGYRPQQRRGILSRTLNLFSIREKENTVIVDSLDEAKEIIDNIKDARKEWLNANMHFEYAFEEELVDYYTYKIKASQVRYEYFLKKAKEMGLKTDTLEVPDIEIN